MTALSRQLDRLAVVMSGICLAHCMLVPIVITLFPLLAVGLRADSHFHAAMLWLVLPVSVLGLGLGFRQHGRTGILLAGGVAMAVLGFASTVGHQRLGDSGEFALMVGASVALAAVHIANLRRVRHCEAV